MIAEKHKLFLSCLSFCNRSLFSCDDVVLVALQLGKRSLSQVH